MCPSVRQARQSEEEHTHYRRSYPVGSMQLVSILANASTGISHNPSSFPASICRFPSANTRFLFCQDLQRAFECEKSTWAMICAVTAVIGDVLEMGVIATTMTTNADNCRRIILWYLLPMMSVDKIIGKFAKSSCQYAVIGELASELMLIYGRFVAVVNCHPSWDVGEKQEVDEYQDNLLTEEEQIVTMGLVWAIH